MAKKSKLSKDAFDWVKPTTQETQPSLSVKTKEPDIALETPSRTLSKKTKKILVKYKKGSGTIAAIVEIPMQQEDVAINPFTVVPEEDGLEEFTLSDDLLKKELLEIHTKYKVDTAGKAPKLVLKR